MKVPGHPQRLHYEYKRLVDMPKKSSRRHSRRQRKTRKRLHKGGFIMQAIGEGFQKGLKQAPKEIISSLRSQGSSYLQPSGSIANYAGNNIQNIIQGHHQELGAHVGKSMQNIKTSLTSSFNKSKSNKTSKIKTYLDPYKFAQKSSISPNLLKKQSMVFNNKYTGTRNDKGYPLQSLKPKQLLE